MAESPLDIVLIDDAVDVRRVVALQIEASGHFHVVAEGGTGREAVDLARAFQPALLLLDVSMPDVDGLSALPAIHQASPATRVAMFSGFSGPELAERARTLGAVDFIEKSLPIRELPARLRQAAKQPAEPVVSGASTTGTSAAAAAPKPPAVPASATAPPAIRPATMASLLPPDPSAARDEGVLFEYLERFSDVFERATVGMATLTLAGTIVRNNGAFAALLLVPGTELVNPVGSRFADLVRLEARDDLEQATNAVVTGQAGSRAVEHGVADKDNWVRSTIAAVPDSTGRPLYLFLQVEDLTDRRLALEELRRSEERFSLLVSNVVDYAIFILDPGGHVMTWNAGAERIIGWSADEILGQHFRIFSTPTTRAARHPEHVLEIALSEGRYEEEAWRVRKDGSRFWALVVVTALFDEAGVLVGFAKVTRDFTQRQQAMAELADAKEVLAAAAAEKGRFLAVAAHELRSPTASVSAAAGMLRDRWGDLDQTGRQELLDVLVSGSGRIRRLVDDVLLASQLEERALRYTPEPVDLASALAAGVRAVPELPAVELDVPPGASAFADPLRLAQILTNLLSNAQAYGASPISVLVSVDERDAVLRVVDAGPGVPEELVRHLFTPFASGPERSARSTGLGLFIARQLARGMGGDAWFERAEGRSVFAVRLPRVAPDQC